MMGNMSTRRDSKERRTDTWVLIIGALVVVAAIEPACLRSAASSERSAPELPEGAILFSSLAPRGWDVYLADIGAQRTRRLTEHRALDYNPAFSLDGERVAFVSERDGNLEIYATGRDGSDLARLTDDFALDDHPSFSPEGKRLAFCSTRQPAGRPGEADNAVFVMEADGRGVVRISPEDATDYSPAWSPTGEWIACASGSGAAGGTALSIMRPDGSERRLVVENGGWPAFSGEGRELYFHRRHRGKWAIWRVNLDGSGLAQVTPDEVEAFTPRVSADGRWLVAAVRRGEHRQIERLELATGQWTAVTDAPTDHWNPSISADGRYVLYHRTAPDITIPNVELWGSPPGRDFQMLRVTGAFPAVSPDARRVAVTVGNFGKIDVMNLDGTDRRTIFTSRRRSVFSLSWGRGHNRIAFSHGTVFQGAEEQVNIETIAPDGSDRKTLTEDAGNNGFPSFSPDGTQLVFRSGRDGSKNLYVMDRDGANIRRVTEGPWTDTMCDWSPTGEWIVFASERGENFEIWLIKPDGTGLRKLIGGGGRNNHPHFSPDGQWIVFTSQRAGLSAEEISLPRQPQPYGDLFAICADGSGLVRLTHNGFEEGTPAWAAANNVKPDEDGSAGDEGEY